LSGYAAEIVRGDEEGDEVLTEAFKIVDIFAERYRRRSEGTRRTYQIHMRHMLRCFHKEGLSIDPNTIGEREANTVLDMNVSDSTKKNYITTLKRFCITMSKDRKNDAIYKMDISFDIVVKNRKTLEYDDYNRILDAVKDPALRIAFVIGGELGLRKSEICNLNTKDIDGDWLTVVRGKGRKTSKLPISDTLMRELDQYFIYREDLVKEYNTDFGGKLIIRAQSRMKTLRPQTLYNHFRRISKEIGAETSPHALRSMYITNKLDSGVPLHITKQLARHEDINMTMKYYRPRDDILMAAQNVEVRRVFLYD